MFYSTVFSSALLVLLASATLARPTLLTMVERMVAHIGTLHVPFPDISGSEKSQSKDNRTVYDADFSCTHGSLEAGLFSLSEGPYLTGYQDSLLLNFSVSVGKLSVNFSSCEEVIQYPTNGSMTHRYHTSSDVIGHLGITGRSLIGIQRIGTSCSISSSFKVTTDVTGVVNSWWNDCSACTKAIADAVTESLHIDMAPVVQNIATGSDLCLLLDY